MRISLGSVYAQILAPSQDLGKGFITAKKLEKDRNFWAVLLVYVVVFHAMGPCESLGRW